MWVCLLGGVVFMGVVSKWVWPMGVALSGCGLYGCGVSMGAWPLGTS